MAREVGDNAHGFQNEKNIVDGLDGKRYKELNLNMKKFVDYVAHCEDLEIDVETEIGARIENDNKKKQDLYLKLLGKEYGISVKMGSGNSTHQEKCEDFIEYIVREFNAADEICNDFRIMIWCDGTLDGTGSIADRIDKKKYLASYASGISRIRNFLSAHQKELIKRILFEGRHNSQVEYIYHGTPLTGKWISAKEMIDFQINNPAPLGTALAKLGRMNLQVWNRSLTGNSDYKRGQIQIKYPGIEEDLEKIMHSSEEIIGTYDGDKEEFNISRTMNKNKKSLLWNTIGYKSNNENLYVVKVTYNAYSKLAKRKVKAKTDAYVVNINLEDKFLLEREYIITEKDIQDIEYDIVKDTGISVKKKDSERFTYEKLSLNSFMELFDAYLENAKLIFCGLTLYQEEKNIQLNTDIITNLNFEVQEIQNEMERCIGKKNASVFEKNDVKKFREYCEIKLREIIEDNDDVKQVVFSGKGCFDAPYYVNYIFKNGSLSKSIIPDTYKISNGSGRSKGNYTIIFKPL